jgi:hypothetical protein
VLWSLDYKAALSCKWRTTSERNKPSPSAVKMEAASPSPETSLSTYRAAQYRKARDHNLNNRHAQSPVARPNKCCTVLPNIFKSSVSYLLDFMLLAPIILGWLLYLWKICVLRLKIPSIRPSPPKNYFHKLRYDSENIAWSWRSTK